MQPFWTLLRRELAGFFISLTGYVVLSGVLLMFGLGFSILLSGLNARPFDQPITEVFYETPFFWLILLLAAPLITMRAYAQEKQSGTYETLMTAPVSDLHVVWAKFTGCLLFFLILWTPLVAYPYLVRHYSSTPIEIATGPMAATFIGIALLGSVYVSAGCFASSLTRSQLIAALTSFSIGMVLFLVGLLTEVDIPGLTWLRDAFQYMSLRDLMTDFTRGIVDTRHLVYPLSLTAFFLFATLKVVESRRWK